MAASGSKADGPLRLTRRGTGRMSAQLLAICASASLNVSLPAAAAGGVPLLGGGTPLALVDPGSRWKGVALLGALLCARAARAGVAAAGSIAPTEGLLE
eukprot:1587095-Prymnesium_polylepis.1